MNRILRYDLRQRLLVVGVLALVIGLISFPSRANAQTVRSSHSPRGALLRSLAIPGWGQLYNHQYYKIPVVYTGLGFLAYIVIDTNSEYLLYRHAFLYKAWEEQIANGTVESNPFPDFNSDYEELLAREGLTEIASSSIEPIRDNLRRNRDLAILGIGVVYALSTLDAYVSAHLLEFDISDDLSVRIKPIPKGIAVNVNLGR